MPENTIDFLDRLIRVNRNAEQNFAAAAERIRNSELETLFGGYAKQHAKFASELQQEIERLGGSYCESGTVGDALHRGWMDVKAAVSGDSAAAMLASCATSEESAEAAYQDASDANPTGKTHALLDKQWQQVKEFRTRLARLAQSSKDGLEFPANE